MEEINLKVLPERLIENRLKVAKNLDKIVKIKLRIMEISHRVKNLILVMDHKTKI